MHFWKSSRDNETISSSTSTWAPPEYTPAAGKTSEFGVHNEAPVDAYEAAQRFCASHPEVGPQFLPWDFIQRIRAEGVALWQAYPPEHWQDNLQGQVQNNNGDITITTRPGCLDTRVISNLPILWGQYSRDGLQGVYYEIEVVKMVEETGSVVSLGCVTTPHPNWRQPGWERGCGLHLDDMHTFFCTPDGGYEYKFNGRSLLPLDLRHQTEVFGFGYEFARGAIFFTRNGTRLDDAFTNQYLGSDIPDVYAAIGVCGETEIRVNFGTRPFLWKPANDEAWRIESHAGREVSGQQPPSYDSI